MVAGAIVGGALTEGGGPRVPILFSGVVTTGAGVLWWALLRSAREDDLTPASVRPPSG
jgi:hypothetical protein